MANKIAISSYSFHRFGSGPEGDKAPTIKQMIDACVDYGADGLEIHSRHLEREGLTSPATLDDLRQYAALKGIAIVSVSASHNFVNPDPNERQKQIDILADWIDVASRLGAPFVRAFGGRWNTLSGQALLKAGGEEPPIDGHTADEGYAWSAAAFKTASFHAGRAGVTLVLENHWGLTGQAAGVLRIIKDTDSRWLKAVLDTGNFLHMPDQYAEMEKLLPHLALVHAKTYSGGGMIFDADLDYDRIAKLLKDAGYNGWLSIEFEGKGHPDQGIPEGIAQVKQAFGLT